MKVRLAHMRRARASLTDGEDLSLDDLLENVTTNGMPEKEEKLDQGCGDHWENADGMRSYQSDMDDGSETEETEADEEVSDDDGRASSEDDSDMSDSYLAGVATSVPRRVQDQKRQEQRDPEQPTNALARCNHFEQYAVVFEQSGASFRAGTATAFAQVPLKENSGCHARTWINTRCLSMRHSLTLLTLWGLTKSKSDERNSSRCRGSILENSR